MDKQEILEKQYQIIEQLLEMNKRLVGLLSQHCDIIQEEKKLKEIEKMLEN